MSMYNGTCVITDVDSSEYDNLIETINDRTVKDGDYILVKNIAGDDVKLWKRINSEYQHINITKFIFFSY